MLSFALVLSIASKLAFPRLMIPLLLGLATMVVATPPAYGDVQDKFIPTFVIKYGGSSGAQSPKQTANFDMLIVSPFHNQLWSENGKNSWESLKAYNPDMKILLYQLGPGEYNTKSWGEIGLGWQWMKDNHGASAGADRWTGKGLTYDYLANTGLPHERIMNLGNTDWQTYWYQTIYSDWWGGNQGRNHTAADGIFSDVTGYKVSYSGRWYDENNVGNPAFKDDPADYFSGGAYNHAKWKSDTNVFFNAAIPWLAGRPEGLILVPNFGYMWTNPEYWTELDNLASPPFAAMEEVGFVTPYGSNTYNVFEWPQKVSTMQGMSNVRVLFTNHGKGSDLGAADGLARMDLQGTDGTTGWDALWFAMSSFLLALNADNINGYMNFTIWGYAEYYWFDEFDPQYLHLGDPVGDYYQSGSVYFREYEDGWVAVNPSLGDANSVAVPRGQALVLNHVNFKNQASAALVTSFNLPSHRGVVLLKPGRKAGNGDNIPTPTSLTPPTNLQIGGQ